jgi:hypothetical protein
MNIHAVYIALAVVYAGFLTYMFVSNTRHKGRPGTMQPKVRPSISNEAGIPVATPERENPGKPGTIS